MTQPNNAPKDFADPTFTPLRNNGRFEKLPEVEQTKKVATDPNYADINPGIKSLAQRNGMVRGALNLYLKGHLTWLEALETMVTALGSELLVNQNILVESRQAYVDLFTATQKPKDLIEGEFVLQEHASDDFFNSKRPLLLHDVH